MYGVHINDETIKVLEEVYLNQLDFYQICKTFKDLCAYSFMVRDTEGNEEEKENPTMDDAISATIIRPLKGDVGYKGMIQAISVKGDIA